MERSPPDGPLNASGALAGEAAAGGARGFSAAWTAVLAALMALLIVATVLGNALVMLAFVADSSLRTQNNFFLLNLAISDFLVGKAPTPGPSPGAPSPAWPAGIGGAPRVPFAQAHAPLRARPGEGASGLVGRWVQAKFFGSPAAGPGKDVPGEGVAPQLADTLSVARGAAAAGAALAPAPP